VDRETLAQRDAAIYVRQSHGKERSLEEQETSGRERLSASGWPLTGVYSDRTSASRFARKDRPDWGRLVGDVERCRFGVLWIWESSRGDRDAETWLGLLRRCRERNVLIHVETHSRTYDMGNARDWRTLAEDGIDNAYESEKTSLRIKRDLRANAAKGRPHGVTLYGYERVYDERTKELREQRAHLQRGPVVREIFRRVAEGDPITRIAGDLNARGIPAPRGGKWGRATVRQLVTNRGYIGQRAAGTREERAQQMFPAIWEPLIDEVTFWAVQRRLTDPARKVTRPGRYLWLLTYLARCHECGAHLNTAREGRYYKCSGGGCTYILRVPADVYVTETVLGLASQPAVLERWAAASDADVMAARAEAGRLQARMDEQTRKLGKGDLDDREYEILRSELRPLIKAAQERARAVTVPPAMRALAGAGDRARAVWDGLPVASQREIVAMAYTITVRKSLRKVPRGGFDPERVVMELREG
jgi:DNA invertase Pin-like site-specific DNA recombinase